jgi:hypothetical protein
MKFAVLCIIAGCVTIALCCKEKKEDAQMQLNVPEKNETPKTPPGKMIQQREEAPSIKKKTGKRTSVDISDIARKLTYAPVTPEMKTIPLPDVSKKADKKEK